MNKHQEKYEIRTSVRTKELYLVIFKIEFNIWLVKTGKN